MSIIKEVNFYDLFNEVNIGRRKFIVQEDHTSKTPFSRRILIGFGVLLLVTVLLLGIVLHIAGVHESGVGELPYLPAFSAVFGQDRRGVEKAVFSAGAKVTYDPAIKAYRLKEPVTFADYQFDVVLSYDANNKLHSVMYTLLSDESAEMMAAHTHQLIEKTQDAWGCSYGIIFSNHYIEYDFADLEKAFTGAESWRREITWIVDKDDIGLGLEDGNCISVRFCADYPGNGGQAQITFTVGVDTAEAGDFAYTP